MKTDEYGRRIRDDKTTPDLATAKRFDKWRGALLAPDVVLTYWDHEGPVSTCTDGWVRSDKWWFVCGAGYPNAVDAGSGQSRNSRLSDKGRYVE